jgi:hypothetical protein
MSLAQGGVRVKLNRLPPSTTETETRDSLDGFVLTETDIKKNFAFVWLISDAEAERAVTTLDHSLIRGN